MKWLVFFLIISNAYSQVFTEDISKISHFLSEEEVNNFILQPGSSSGIDGSHFQSLSVTPSMNVDNNCEENPAKSKPLNLRYEVIAVTEEKPTDPKLPPQTTVIVAKFEEPENPIVTDIKNLISNQVQNGSSGGPMGKFELKQHRDAGKTIVLYAGPGTNIDVSSTVKAEGAMNLDVKPLFGGADPSSKLVSPTIQMDIVNRLSVNQEIAEGYGLKTTLETLHTTGVRGLDSLQGTKFNLSTFKAQTRLDAQLDRSTKTYTEVNYTTNTFDKEIRAVAGFDIKAPNNAQILVFTGYTNKHSAIGRDPAAGYGNSKELGFEYKKKNGTTIYSKFKDGTERGSKSFETGIRIPLGR